jgi:GH15 family glucan-1,4-alpha-glucosidase
MAKRSTGRPLLHHSSGRGPLSPIRAVSGHAFSCSTRHIPISEHGLIGDLRTAALVGTNGTIDWYCCPRFDAPGVFGSVLDTDRGGSFELAAEVPTRTRQFHFPDTNVLITRFFAADGVAEIQDFMPVVDGSREAARHRLRCSPTPTTWV